MTNSFDVYAIHRSGELWLGNVLTFADVIQEMQLSGPGDYCVFSQITMNGFFFNVSESGAVSLVASRDELSRTTAGVR